MKHITIFLFALMWLASCQPSKSEQTDEQRDQSKEKIPVIMDTDANNELDDQHALAYLIFNPDVFDIKGITVNATFNGGDIEDHYAEARRVIDLCDAGDIPLFKGANGDFPTISPTLDEETYDGKRAVDFIVSTARNMEEGRLVLLPIGKLTNIALALQQAPDIREKVRVVWLGSNYPEPGEYNQDNDTASLNYVLDQDVPFEMVTVRYGKPSGSDAVRVTPEVIKEKMSGKGPRVAPVEGRHGDTFTSFGDYSVNLFSKIDLYGDPPSRALFDAVAVAVLKNPAWGERKEIPAPILVDNEWVERPQNPRTIMVWENFDEEAILEDFFSVME